MVQHKNMESRTKQVVATAVKKMAEGHKLSIIFKIMKFIKKREKRHWRSNIGERKKRRLSFSEKNKKEY